MANRKSNPIITHTEIICLAIRSIDADIGLWRQRFDGMPEEIIEERLLACTADLMEKRDALKALYRIETGTEYD